MKFSTAIAAVAGLASTVSAAGSGYVYERLNRNDTLLVILDHQVGLQQVVRDFDATVYKNQIMAYASLGKLFSLPVVMTTSSETGPNGPLPKEILEMYPDAPLIKRQGEVNAWDNPDFRAAVKATNKTQIIIAGIVTDVCTTFAALSLREAGYNVWAEIEASGTNNELVRDISNLRMHDAGVHVMSLFAVFCELMRDWRNAPGVPAYYPYLEKYYPIYGTMIAQHNAAITNGTL